MCFQVLAVKFPPDEIFCSAVFPLVVIANRLPFSSNIIYSVGVDAAAGPAVNKLTASAVLLQFTHAVNVIVSMLSTRLPGSAT